MRQRAGQFSFPWGDIQSVTLGALGDDPVERSTFGRLIGMSDGNTVVRLVLNRRLKKHWLWERWGTREFGIPLGKSMPLAPTDPDALMAGVAEFMETRPTKDEDRDVVT